jgi:SOS-response transcriptional repressor LexA
MVKTYAEQVAERLVAFGNQRFGKKYGWKTKFANALQMKPQGLQPYLDGIRIPGNTILARLNNIGCSSDWLLYGKSGGNDVTIPVELMNVPVYESISAGKKETVVMEDIVEYIAIPKSTDTTLFGVKVKGNSMLPRIKPDDVVIASIKAEVKSGDLCLVNWEDGEYSLRYVHFQDKFVTLISENEKLSPPLTMPKTKINQLIRVMKIIQNL